MRLNSRKKKIETKFIVLGIILLVCFAIGLISLTVKEVRGLSILEKGIKDVGVGIERVLYSPFRLITDTVDDYKDMKRVYQKYKDVDKIDEKATLLETENKELKKSLEELKSLLDLNKLMTEYTPVNATVINRNVGNWYNTITIDKGEKKGLKTDMMVMTDKGLIGKIIKTSFYTSEVKLITTADLNNKISVAIISGDATTYGILSGYDINKKKLSVIDIVNETTIKVGDKVITSGLSDLFPRGIVVGIVSEIENDDFGISKTIKVTPAVDFTDIRYVTVLGAKKND